MSWRLGVVSLIPKNRFIYFFSQKLALPFAIKYNYKIATKRIASRLKHVLPSIINLDQTGYLKRMYIGQNIRLLYHRDDTDELDIPGLLFCIFFFRYRKGFWYNWMELKKSFRVSRIFSRYKICFAIEMFFKKRSCHLFWHWLGLLQSDIYF